MSTFAEMLAEGLVYGGVTSRKAQIEIIAEVAEVSHKTARSWLKGACKPRSYVPVWKLAKHLRVDMMWLWNGGGKSPTIYREDREILEFWRSLSSWEQNKFRRLLFRLKNNDRKAKRMLTLASQGIISRGQLFSAM